MTARSAAPYPRLLGDVGGTHARFGWIDEAGADVTHVVAYRVADHAGLESVIACYLRDEQRPRPASCAIGIATPITGDTVTMTNLAWTFSVRDVQRRFGLQRLLLINDFTALAHALPTLTAGEAWRVGSGDAVAGAPLALFGPGTGLGAAGLVATASGFVPLTGEGGHATLGGMTATEDRVIALLREWFGHASAERALSGSGLVNLHRASGVLAQRDALETLDSVEITARARAGSDPHCVEAVGWFFAFLGSFAGNLALTLGARGGVYVAGGIVPALGDMIARSSFRERFEAKGRFRAYLAAIPTSVIADPTLPALRGANVALDADLS